MASFVYVTHISATAEQAWRALTGPAFAMQYWAGRIIFSDWQVGSPVTITKNDGSLNWYGKVLEYKPPHRLSYTFSIPPDQPGEASPLTHVQFVISEHGPIVQLTASHEGFTHDARSLEGVSRRWPFILSDLKGLLERQEPPFAWRA
jgi:uncharacterized protein YndB with AHSA1/START domain